MYAIFAAPRRLPAAIAAVFFLLACACGRSHTYSTADGKVSYQEKGKDARTITVTGKDGKSATLSFNENKLPADYPKDVPVYSPVKVVMSQSAADRNASNLVLESVDSSGQIVDFYKKGLEDNGWSTGTTMTTGQLTMLTATKNQRQLTLQVTDSGGKRNIMQVLADKN